jgi:hemolysin activation/secretion protein
MGNVMRSGVPTLVIAGLVAALWPHVAPAANDAAAAPASSTDTQQNVFDIGEFRVLGNHVLPATVIERVVYPFLGPARTIDTVKQAADALEKAYKDAGYATVYVDIPEQDVNGGLVRLKVTEGRLEHVHVRGERYFSGRQIVAALPALKPGQTPELPALQTELAALNARTPDRSITPVLKAGSQPGTVDVDLTVKDSLPLHGSVQYDDQHTADTTPNRSTVALSYDNLWQRQDSAGMQYQTAPAKPSDAEVLIANYSAHLGAQGALAAFSYTHTSSNVAALGTLGVLGKGSIYGAHWIEPVFAGASSSQNVNFGADYKDVLTTVLPNTTGSASSSGVTAHVKYVNWSALYSGAWWRETQSYSVTAGVAFGVRSVINSVNEFENARYNANPDYLYVRLGFNGSQALPFLGLKVSERASGQWADSPLVNNEQFSLGGTDSVRGYLAAETLGDSGLSGSLELHSPALGARVGSFFSPLYAFLFVDGGVANIVDPLPAQRENVTLWSDGVGLRLENSHGWIGTVDYAVPRRNGVRTLKDQSRIDFLLRYGF